MNRSRTSSSSSLDSTLTNADKKSLREADKAAKKADKERIVALKKAAKETKNSIIAESDFTLSDDNNFRVKSVRRSNALYDPDCDDEDDGGDDDEVIEEEPEGTQLWELAADWMTQVGTLPKIGESQNRTAGDFFMFLMDGTALCETLKAISSTSVEQFHDHPVENFRKVANAIIFVDGCNKLGVDTTSMVSTEELQNGGFFGLVKTIANLSQSGESKFPSFSATGHVATAIYQKTEAQIQGAIDNGVVNETKSSQAMLDQGPTLFNLAESEQTLEGFSSIYEKARRKNSEKSAEGANDWDMIAALVNEETEQNQNQSGADVYQALLYTTSLYQDSDTTNHRSHALQELLDTERKYLGVLNTLTDVYHKGLKAHTKIVNDDDLTVLFANIFELQGIHKAFLKLIEAQMQSSSGRMLGNAFIHSIECFRAYAEYCCLMPAAIERYEALRAKSQPALSLFDDLRKQSGNDFAFRILLNVPMQRVLKYPLLIREIQKGTPDTHSDKENLNEAAVQIKGLAKLVNETMRNYENVEAVAKRLKNYTGPPLAQYHTFHKSRISQFLDKDLAYKREGSKDKLAKTYGFLFPSAILISQSKGQDYLFNTLIKLDKNTKVEAIETPKALQTGKFKNQNLEGIKITVSSSETHLLVFEGEAARGQWASAVENNIKAITESIERPAAQIPEPSKLPAPRNSRNGSPRASPTPEDKDNSEPYAMAQPEKKAPSHPFAKMPWYMGKAGANDAAKVLQGKKDSTYLIRESTNRPGNYTLGVMFEGKVVHIPIASTDGGTKFVLGGAKAVAQKHDSIVALVQHYRTNDVATECRTKLKLPFKEAR